MSKTHIILDEIVAAKPPLGARVAAHDILTITDLEGQRAVDFRCYEADNPKDRHYASNTASAGQHLCGARQHALLRPWRSLMMLVEDPFG
jgi:uncharacterized protein YcgI (DUF1989 family)